MRDEDLNRSPLTPTGLQQVAMREPTAREILESRMLEAERQALDYRVFLDMLPTRMTHQQEMALKNLLEAA